jgi:hypothetical protein
VRQFRLLISIWLVITALIGSVVLYGRSQPGPNPLQALGFAFCGDRLCFMGILPGVTRWEDAEHILIWGGANLSMGKSTFSIDHMRVVVDYDPGTQIVRLLMFLEEFGAPLPLTIGDILAYWGTPCGFTPDTVAGKELLVLYPHQYVALNLDVQHIDLAMPLRYLVIPSANVTCKDYVSWPGLTTPERYRSLYFNAPTSP